MTSNPAGADPLHGQGDSVSAPLVNPANAITVVRVLLVPLFGWLLLQPEGGWWRVGALAVFVVASVTDHLDGELARRRNLVTDFGKIADPLADKALTGMALVGLSVLGELWWWVTAVIMLREVGVTLLRFWVIRRGVIAASAGGKLKTVLQIAAIILYILPLHWTPLHIAEMVVMGAALVVTVVTGIDYVWRARALRRGGADRAG